MTKRILLAVMGWAGLAIIAVAPAVYVALNPSLVTGRLPAPVQFRPHAAPQPSHEAVVYAQLWKLCEEKHLTYQVKSSWSVDHYRYHAFAWTGLPFHIYQGDGDGPTEAVEDLLKRLREPASTYDSGEVTPQ